MPPRAAASSATERALLAAAAACVTSVLAYALVRCAEVALFAEANPRAVSGAERSPFVWRCALALYLGGMGSFGGYALAARAPRAAPRWIRVGVVAAIAALLAQAALAP